jgi:hypothetical protein
MLILKIKKYYFNIFLKKITNTYIYIISSQNLDRGKRKKKKREEEEEEEEEEQRPCEKYIQFCD